MIIQGSGEVRRRASSAGPRRRHREPPERRDQEEGYQTSPLERPTNPYEAMQTYTAVIIDKHVNSDIVVCDDIVLD